MIFLRRFDTCLWAIQHAFFFEEDHDYENQDLDHEEVQSCVHDLEIGNGTGDKVVSEVQREQEDHDDDDDHEEVLSIQDQEWLKI